MSTKDLVLMVTTMLENGASKNAAFDFVDKLLKKGKITTRAYELVIGTINDKQGA